MHLTDVEPGTLGPCPVAPDSLQGIKRQQTNPARWNAPEWKEFAAVVRAQAIELRETMAARAAFATDAGGTAYGLAHGVVIARSSEQVAQLLQAAQQFQVPVTVCGGGLTTEGESVAFGGVLLDMSGMSRVLSIDAAALTVRTEAGIFWHSLAEELRRRDLDYLSAPLNLTSSVGGTLGVGGIDVNSARLGGYGELGFGLRTLIPYLLRPWKLGEAWYLLQHGAAVADIAESNYNRKVIRTKYSNRIPYRTSDCSSVAIGRYRQSGLSTQAINPSFT